ncbi:Netrin-B [Vespula squamosa]|uniref:Netrin-B n=1 Tax=Vespula squamosa TaxID=30214 RepID=A0ABD2A810_VESSQ
MEIHILLYSLRMDAVGRRFSDKVCDGSPTKSRSSQERFPRSLKDAKETHSVVDNSVWSSLLGGTKCTEVDNTMVRANDEPDECLGNLREAKHQCGKCRASTKRLNLNKYCKRDYAILGRITDRHKKSDGSQSGSSVSGTSWIQSKLKDSTRRYTALRAFCGFGLQMPQDQTQQIQKQIVDSRRVHRSYLILGQESDGGGQGGLTVTQRSIVIEWRDEWHRRMRRFQRRARSCH